MLKVGITGQSGFMGTHLYNFLRFKKEEIRMIPFEDRFFEEEELLNEFVSSCDTIVHLAAMNRHGDPQVIYSTNINLVKQLLRAIEGSSKRPHLVFSSSIQEERDNLYGKSKLDGRILFEEWATRSGSKFTGLIIPNVFGPFGKPFYNSVISTFSHQLINNEQPRIEIDAKLKLIYINELLVHFYNHIMNPGKSAITRFEIPHTAEYKVTEILSMLEVFKKEYYENNCFPELHNEFSKNLFNTFRSYIDYANHYPIRLIKNVDQRGYFIETTKASIGGQFSYSTTVPGITRGNHFHMRKIERFIVIKGSARIDMRRIGASEIISYNLSGDEPAFVDIPLWYTHNITNTGEDELIAMFWINEFYNPDDPDTFYESV